MKKRIGIILIIIAIILIIVGIFIFNKNEIFQDDKMEILDATYSCESGLEVFYEDDEYLYAFNCQKSSSVFVKFSDGNKMLVKTALEEDKVTIEELEKAGLEFTKTMK